MWFSFRFEGLDMSQLQLLYRLNRPGSIVRLAAGSYPDPQTGLPPWTPLLEHLDKLGTTLDHRFLELRGSRKGKAA